MGRGGGGGGRGCQHEHDEYRAEQRRLMHDLEAQTSEARQAATTARIEAARAHAEAAHMTGTSTPPSLPARAAVHAATH